MHSIRRHALPLALAIALAAPAAAAQAGVMDFLFGSKKVDTTEAAANPDRRTWRIGEFTAIQLAKSEAGSPANQHPASLHPEGIRQQLALVRVQVKGRSQPLFSADELNELAEPLSQALANAKPADDVLLLSTSRRDGGVLSTPLGVTARLFVQGGALNLIVNDARRDFVNAYIGSRIAPQFDFGSRAKAGEAVLQSAVAPNKRADWVALPLAAAATPAAAPIGAPATPAAIQARPSGATANAAPSPAIQPPAASLPAAPAAPAALKARDDAFYAEQAQRLKGLKSLRDQGAITEDEYQQKRKEILSTL